MTRVTWSSIKDKLIRRRLTSKNTILTKDLASLIGRQKWLNTQDFLDRVDRNLQSAMGLAKAA